jgi:hypothetical protein
MGRNTSSLANLKKKVLMPDRLEIVQVTGDKAADCEKLKKFGEIDAYFDHWATTRARQYSHQVVYVSAATQRSHQPDGRIS